MGASLLEDSDVQHWGPDLGGVIVEPRERLKQGMSHPATNLPSSSVLFTGLYKEAAPDAQILHKNLFGWTKEDKQTQLYSS